MTDAVHLNAQGGRATASEVMRQLEFKATPVPVSQGFAVSIPSITNRNYFLEFKDEIDSPTWSALPSVPGSGGALLLNDPTGTNHTRLNRVREQ